MVENSIICDYELSGVQFLSVKEKSLYNKFIIQREITAIFLCKKNPKTIKWEATLK